MMNTELGAAAGEPKGDRTRSHGENGENISSSHDPLAMPRANSAPLTDEEIRGLTDTQVLAMINKHRNAREIEQMERYFAESGRRQLWQDPAYSRRQRPRRPRCPTCGR